MNVLSWGRLQAAIEVLKGRGGKLHCILSSRPSKGLRALQQRDTTAVGAEKAEKEKQTVLIPQDNTYRTLAIRAADHQVCVDMFFLSQAYMDVATLSTLCQTTGGSIYRYAPFQPQYDEDQFVNDLRYEATLHRFSIYMPFLALWVWLHCVENAENHTHRWSGFMQTCNKPNRPSYHKTYSKLRK